MIVIHVVGARPNFVKVASVIRALESKAVVRQILVHTRLCYGFNISE